MGDRTRTVADAEKLAAKMKAATEVPAELKKKVKRILSETVRAFGGVDIPDFATMQEVLKTAFRNELPVSIINGEPEEGVPSLACEVIGNYPSAAYNVRAFATPGKKTVNLFCEKVPPGGNLRLRASN